MTNCCELCVAGSNLTRFPFLSLIHRLLPLSTYDAVALAADGSTCLIPFCFVNEYSPADDDMNTCPFKGIMHDTLERMSGKE